ncbi:glycoside hydrolase family 32 protein [Catenovulum adriaticum]|uniref:Glycoside hydrolase family 32 protein n=1 Tax=Catenovulum adriaticum TaxID=2984846 RepID=A0ABY7AUK3_9ALTE|nr:glycoside hydrolase family 32 protein [Catenovulum sp. TS8]WAJ71951.1 glycoside hydrolase family 32 protein [Catenovulum sp. TS8]
MPNNIFTPQWRPKAHFTPEQNWMNDPNGLVYYNGKYHLFYQYNPHGNDWGNMNWGHATSTDLVNWHHHPVAVEMSPKGLGYIYSGSAVVDYDNTSGLQTGEHPPLVALFTHTEANTEVQRQSLAYSLDGGDSWQQYANNPVIENPGIVDFRDPKVSWHPASSQWIMALTAGHSIEFYASKNLFDWAHISSFGEDDGSHQGEWECPDLFELTTETGIKKWVLLVSLVPGGPNGGSGTQYFIGDFDGVQFKAEHQDVRWLDYGPDNYAGVTWDGRQTIDNRRTLIAWMSNWTYAEDMPTFPWRGAMCLPRDLSLTQIDGNFYVTNLPAKEVLDSSQIVSEVTASDKVLSLPLSQKSALDIQLSCEITQSDKLYIRMFNDAGETVELKYLPQRQKLVVDRSQAGWSYKLWRTPRLEAKTFIDSGKVNARLVLDTSSLEVFWQQGSTTMTICLLPTQPFNRIEISSDNTGDKKISLAEIK